jgi:hypothetical protein
MTSNNYSLWGQIGPKLYEKVYILMHASAYSKAKIQDKRIEIFLPGNTAKLQGK